MSLSAIIITRNEEGNIQECLKKLEFLEEIIVVDNGSTDETVSLAKKLGAKVYKVPGLDFSYLRNLGKEKANSVWLLYIDADERVTEELAAEIKKVLSSNKDFYAYSLLRKNYYLGYPWPKIERITRLIKKEALLGWQGTLHETPLIAGKVGKLSSLLLHYTHRDLSSMLAKTNEWSEIEAQLRYQSGHPKVVWWRFFRVMFTAFWQSFILGGGWRAGIVGVIESIYQAFSMFVTYAKLWEKQYKRETAINN